MIEILRLSLPLTIWVTGFSALYALQGLTCSRHWPVEGDARLILVAAATIAVAAQGLCLLVLARHPSPSRFVQTTALTLTIASLVAAVWLLVPILATSTCL